MIISDNLIFSSSPTYSEIKSIPDLTPTLGQKYQNPATMPPDAPLPSSSKTFDQTL